jgi:hypothetical protein
MTPKRPKSLKWIGEMYPDGRPARFLDFLPPEDIDEARTDELTQDQLKVVRDSGLYREVHPPEKKASKKAARSEPATAPEPADTTDDSNAAETPATDGGDAAEGES